DDHRAIFLLVVFQHGDKAATNSSARAVERVDVAQGLLFAGRAIPRFHTACLEIAAHRDRRDLAIGILAREPYFKVIGATRAKAHVAGAQLHHAIVETKLLQNGLSSREHALVFVLGFFCRGDRNKLNLVELVLTQHTARVAASRPGLGTEAWG